MKRTKKTARKWSRDWFAFFEANTKDCDISYRGGTLKIDVSEIFPEIAENQDGGDAIIGAYQNYLGGGIAGAIVGAAMFEPEDLENDKQRELFFEALEAVKRYFYSLNNGGGDEYMQENVTGESAGGYEENQKMDVRYPGL